MTVADFAYDRGTVSELVRRIGAEQQVPAAAYDLIERFVSRLPDAALTDVLNAFQLLPGAAK